VRSRSTTTDELSLTVGEPRPNGRLRRLGLRSGVFPEARKELAVWIGEGQLKAREHIVEGIETFPETFLKLFSGKNFGKLVIKIADG
jgi:hypothetical protein